MASCRSWAERLPLKGGPAARDLPNSPWSRGCSPGPFACPKQVIRPCHCPRQRSDYHMVPPFTSPPYRGARSEQPSGAQMMGPVFLSLGPYNSTHIRRRDWYRMGTLSVCVPSEESQDEKATFADAVTLIKPGQGPHPLFVFLLTSPFSANTGTVRPDSQRCTREGETIRTKDGSARRPERFQNALTDERQEPSGGTRGNRNTHTHTHSGG